MNLSPLSFIFFLVAVLLIVALVWWLVNHRATPHVESVGAGFIDAPPTSGEAMASWLIDHALVERAKITDGRHVGSGVFFLTLDTGTSYWYVPGMNHLQEVPQCETGG